jgi:hypothetical protein
LLHLLGLNHHGFFHRQLGKVIDRQHTFARLGPLVADFLSHRLTGHGLINAFKFKHPLKLIEALSLATGEGLSAIPLQLPTQFRVLLTESEVFSVEDFCRRHASS